MNDYTRIYHIIREYDKFVVDREIKIMKRNEVSINCLSFDDTNKDIIKTITCFVCDNIIEAPRIFSCFHSFCSKCIKNDTCPICCQSWHIHQSQDNHYIEIMKKISLQCPLCDEQISASNYTDHNCQKYKKCIDCYFTGDLDKHVCARTPIFNKQPYEYIFNYNTRYVLDKIKIIVTMLILENNLPIPDDEFGEFLCDLNHALIYYMILNKKFDLIKKFKVDTDLLRKVQFRGYLLGDISSVKCDTADIKNKCIEKKYYDTYKIFSNKKSIVNIKYSDNRYHIQKSNISLPNFLQKELDKFTQYHDVVKKSRKIQWCYGKAEIQFNGCDIIVTTIQMLILLLYNEFDKLTSDEIAAKLNVPIKIIKNEMILFRRYKLLIDGEVNNKFNINFDFSDTLVQKKYDISPIVEATKTFKISGKYHELIRRINVNYDYEIEKALIDQAKECCVAPSDAIEQVAKDTKWLKSTIIERLNDLTKREYVIIRNNKLIYQA
jgi:hypothetical protein